jgi:mono/diheme cytochrome c family protein
MPLKYLAFICCSLTVLVGCRGTTMDKPPVHPNQNMDFQNRYDPQEESPFFADGRAMRTPVEGTVRRGALERGTPYVSGIDSEGNPVESIPRHEVDEAFVRQGQRQFNTYCQPCHGSLGDGNGVIGAEYWPVPVTSFHIDRLRDAPDGEFFQVITGGVRTMPGYAHQVDVEDRWAIVAYIRALQRSQNVPRNEVPPGERAGDQSTDE